MLHALARLVSVVLLTTSAAMAAAPGDAPDVVTDIAPVHALVARVMTGVGVPDLIIPPGASPHDYSLRPSEANAMQRAALVVWMGPGLTPWLSHGLDTLAADARQIRLLERPETAPLPLREGAGFAGHMHGEDDHEHDGIDPHAWLDPGNARRWLGVIAAELSRLDPAHAETYSANAAAGQAELDALIVEIAARLAPVQDTAFLVYHDAYQYFEARFGLSATGAIAKGDAAPPGPARIAQMKRLAQAQGVACLFTEPQFDPKLVRTVFGQDVTVGVLDPVGSALPPGPDLYPSMLRAMAGEMVTCLSGGRP